MDMQNVKNLTIPEGDVKMIHDKDNRLLWGAVGYNTKYAGDTTQQTYSGKNLLQLKQRDTQSQGITATINSDGSITVSGTASATYADIAASSYPSYSFPIGTSLTFSIGEALPVVVRAFFGGWTQINAGQTQGTSTTTVNTSNMYMSLSGLTVGTTYNFTIKKPMLEQGSTATSYEPYVGGTASPNPDYPQDIQVVTGTQTVKVTGKNLWNFRTKQEDWHASSTVVDDNSISVTGTTNNGAQSATFSVPCKPNTTYTLTRTLNVITAGNDTGRIYIQDNNGYITNISTSQSSKTFTTSATASKIVLIFFANVTGTPSTAPKVEFSNVQVEKGSTATTYEPYQGASYNVHLIGKNLWTLNSTYTTSTGNQYVLSDTKIPTIPAGTYTLSLTKSQDEKVLFAFKNSSNSATNVYINEGENNKTVTFAEDIVKAAIYLYGNSGWTISNIQLEQGPTPTSYSSYYAPIELCKIDTYQDYIYKSGDDWYVKRAIGKVTFDGSESWSTNSPWNYDNTSIYILSGTGNAIASPAISDHFIYSSSVYSLDTNGIFGIVWSDRAAFRVSNTIASTSTDWKTWLSTHNTTVYYALATATDTKITNSTLIGELEAVHEWMTRYGYQASVTGNLPMIIRQDALT